MRANFVHFGKFLTEYTGLNLHRLDLSPDASTYTVGYIRNISGRLFNNGAECFLSSKNSVLSKKLHFLLGDGKFPLTRKLATEDNVRTALPQRLLTS